MKAYLTLNCIVLTSLISAPLIVCGAADSEIRPFSSEAIGSNSFPDSRCKKMAMFNDGTEFGTLARNEKIIYNHDKTDYIKITRDVVQFWNAHTGAPVGSTYGICRIEGEKQHTLSCGKVVTKYSCGNPITFFPDFMAVSPDARYVAVAGMQTAVKLFDLQRPDAAGDAQTFLNKIGYNNELAFTRDGRLISTSSSHQLDRNKKTISAAFYIHTIAEDGKITRSERHEDSFINGTRRIAASSTHNQFVIGMGSKVTFHRSNGERIRKILVGTAASIITLKYSPDGESLFAGGARMPIRQFDVETGENIRSLKTNKVVDTLAVSPDGNTIATETTSRKHGGTRIHMWDIRSEKEVQTFHSEQSCIIGLAFNDRGNLISAAPEGVKIWSNDPSLGSPVVVGGDDDESA